MNYKVSNRQTVLTFFIITSLSIRISNMIIYDLGQDFWQAILISLVIDGTLGWFLFKMGRKYVNQTIFQYSEKILGKYLGKINAGIFTLFFIGVAITLTQGLIDFFGAVIMPETPKYAFALLLLLVSTYACYSGIEVIMRLSEIIAPFVLGSFVFIMLFNVGKMDTQNLRPVFQHGFLEVVRGSLLPTSWFGICIVMGVLMAYQNNPKDMYKVKVIGVGLGILTQAVTMLFIIMVIGVETSSRQIYSVYVLARIVNVGEFIERLEAFQVASWTAGSFLIVALFQYAGTEGIRHFFPKKSRFFLGLGVAGVIFIFSVFLYPTSFDKNLFGRDIFGTFALAVEIGGVTTLFLIHVLKDKYKASKKRSK